MSETHFDRAEWRTGKHRASYPRVRDWGGRREPSPGMLAHVQPGVFAPGAPRCRHCARVAMRDLPVCRQHGGARWAAARRPYVARQTPKPGSDTP